MRRREFMRDAAIGSGALAMVARVEAAAKIEAKPDGGMPVRAFGKDGVKLSVIGFPGLLLRRYEQKDANRLIAEAFERGVNYYDVAPAYGDAEHKMGPALEKVRKKVFLACKTKMRDREGAKMEFERSLQRLRTDHFDLYQLHVLTDVKKDVDQAFAKDGAMAYLQEQRKAGRIRYLGFSAHTEEAAIAALDRFQFDSIMFPVNFVSWFNADFGPKVVKKAREKGTAVLAIKGFARQRWPEGDPERKKLRFWYKPITDSAEAAMALRFTLSQGATASIPPSVEIGHKAALDAGPAAREITPEEMAKLRAIAKGIEPLFPRGPLKSKT